MTRKCKTIMVQGTGSHVGKSIIVSALCRIFKQDGYKVAPFKAQNMALNSYVTESGGEIGRAQATQAECAGIKPTVDMNPVLLKPSSDTGAQVIVLGKPIGNMDAKQYHKYKPKLKQIIKNSFNNLEKDNDIIVIEGAGSPAEINLRKNDIVNMEIALMFNTPVLLVGDINLGGVFAWIVGTLNLLTKKERNHIKGILINKFRGDIKLLNPGNKILENIIHKPVLGTIPYFHDIKIPEEDSVHFDNNLSGLKNNKITIEILYLPHISNFTDFDPLEHEPNLNVRYIKPGDELGNPDCIIIPGSKNTISDLQFLKKYGYADKIIKKAGENVVIMGICGGYQMLGKEINDPYKIETNLKNITGLGLLPIKTTILKHKTTHQVYANDLIFNSGKIKGYEIHMGQSEAFISNKPCFTITKQSNRNVNLYDGCISKSGNIFGTYIHGLFENDLFRTKFVQHLNKSNSNISSSTNSYLQHKEKEYNKLAELVRNNIDLKAVYKILNTPVK